MKLKDGRFLIPIYGMSHERLVCYQYRNPGGPGRHVPNENEYSMLCRTRYDT
jgi:hypothetical protein